MVFSSRFGYTIPTLSRYGRCVVHVTYEGMYHVFYEFLYSARNHLYPKTFVRIHKILSSCLAQTMVLSDSVY
jgi:hypothetical protein